MLGVEKVRRPKVVIAHFLTRIDGFHVDRHVDLRGFGLVRIDSDGSGDGSEAAANRRDHEVTNSEPEFGVGGIDRPGGRSLLGGGHG